MRFENNTWILKGLKKTKFYRFTFSRAKVGIMLCACMCVCVQKRETDRIGEIEREKLRVHRFFFQMPIIHVTFIHASNLLVRSLSELILILTRSSLILMHIHKLASCLAVCSYEIEKM